MPLLQMGSLRLRKTEEPAQSPIRTRAGRELIYQALSCPARRLGTPGQWAQEIGMETQNLGIWEKMKRPKTHEAHLGSQLKPLLLCPSVLFWVSGNPEGAFQGPWPPSQPSAQGPCAYLHPLPLVHGRSWSDAPPAPSQCRIFLFRGFESHAESHARHACRGGIGKRDFISRL